MHSWEDPRVFYNVKSKFPIFVLYIESVLHWNHFSWHICVMMPCRSMQYVLIIYHSILKKVLHLFIHRKVICSSTIRIDVLNKHHLEILAKAPLHSDNRVLMCWLRSMKLRTKVSRHCWSFEGSPPMTGGFPSQRVSNVECLPISRRHNNQSKELLSTLVAAGG